MAAHAVIKVMEYNDENVRTEEETEELRGLKERLGNLYYDQEQGNESDELSDEISEIEGRIEEIEEKYDVYDLVPSRYKFYGNLYRFDLEWGAAKGNEYAAGKEEDAEAAALEYAEQYIDENGVRVFNENFWMDHLDEEGILDYFRDFYEDDIRNNTEVYFDDDDFELTTEQEARKEQLESYIEEMEDLLSETEEEQRNLEDSDSEEYYDLDEKIKKPSELSGGMKQRVGIARAFAIEPKMLLLDEPFGALDALTRGVIQDELLKICASTKQTVFMITHDVDEAILLSDKIMLMSNGPNARIAEIVENTLPKNRERATMHHDLMYYPMRNHLVDFLVHRSKLVQQSSHATQNQNNVRDITQRLKPRLVRPGKEQMVSNQSTQMN